MKRFWVTLPDDTFNTFLSLAEETGASVGSLAAEMITNELLKRNGLADKTVPPSSSSIQETLLSSLNLMPTEKLFYIRDLVDDTTWNSLTRSQKMIYSKTLARIIKNDSQYSLAKVQNKINFYMKGEKK